MVIPDSFQIVSNKKYYQFCMLLLPIASKEINIINAFGSTFKSASPL